MVKFNATVEVFLYDGHAMEINLVLIVVVVVAVLLCDMPGCNRFKDEIHGSRFLARGIGAF